MNRKNALKIFVVIILIFTAHWLYTHSFVEVYVDNAGDSEVTYDFFDQDTEIPSSKKETKKKIKKLVRKGAHEVLVSQDGNSYFTVVKASGFMTTTKVEAHLEPEDRRQFVGDGPDTCMHYLGQVLYSYACGLDFLDVKRHEPATAELPTYVAQEPIQEEHGEEEISGTIQGFARTSQGPIILLKTPNHDETPGEHRAFLLNNNFELGRELSLPDLNIEKDYVLQGADDGFVIYDLSYDEIFLYGSLDEAPKKIQVDPPKIEGLEPYHLSVSGKTVAVTFGLGVLDDGIPTETEKGDTWVVSNQDGQQQTLKLKRSLVNATLCGEQRICTLGDEQLDVYDISGKKPKLLYSVKKVVAIENSTKGLLVFRENEILMLDVSGRYGFTSFALGDYTFCGLSLGDKTYTLCVLNNKDKRVALHIDQQQPNIDSIDKKIALLLKHAAVDDVSIYGDYIYVIPKLGEFIYNPVTGITEPSIIEVAQTRKAIRQYIEELKIDTSKYKIINPYESNVSEIEEAD